MGVSVIMLVSALITGFDEQIQENIKQFGADTAFVSRWDQGPHGNSRPLEERLRKPLTLDGRGRDEGKLPGDKKCHRISDWWEKTHTIRTKAGEVTGHRFPRRATEFWRRSTPMPRCSPAGSSVKATIFTAKKSSCSAKMSRRFYSRKAPAVGKDVMIDGSDFQVIGVVEKPKGGFGIGDEDRRVLIPYNTFHKVYPGAYENQIRVQAYPNMLDQAVDQVTEVLRRRRNVAYNAKDNFAIRDRASMQVRAIPQHRRDGRARHGRAQFHRTADRRRRRDEHHAGQRHRAHPRNRHPQSDRRARATTSPGNFLLEAMTLTGAGGIIALILVNGLVMLIRMTLEWHGSVPLWAAAAGSVVSVSVGLVFGVWPAMKAAKLDPVEALRYE